MTHAKFIDENTVRFAPRKYQTPYLISFHFNENVELMKQEGFYPVIETNKPEDVQDETHYARPTYELIKVIVDENNEEPINTETTAVDDYYIECTYVAEEIVEESQEEAPEVEAPEVEGEG